MSATDDYKLTLFFSISHFSEPINTNRETVSRALVAIAVSTQFDQKWRNK